MGPGPHTVSVRCLKSMLQKFSPVFLRDRRAQTDTPVPGRQPPNGRLAISAWIVPWSPCCVSRAHACNDCVLCVSLCTLPARPSAGVAHLTAPVVLRPTARTGATKGDHPMTNPSTLFVPFVAHAHHRRHPTTLWTPDAKGNPLMPTSIFRGSLSIRPARSRPNRLSCPLWGLCAAIPPGPGT